MASHLYKDNAAPVESGVWDQLYTQMHVDRKLRVQLMVFDQRYDYTNRYDNSLYSLASTVASLTSLISTGNVNTSRNAVLII